jgi:LCP family protein required for cell wall assembly
MRGRRLAAVVVVVALTTLGAVLLGPPAVRSVTAAAATAGLAGALGRSEVGAADLAPVTGGQPVIYLLVGSDGRDPAATGPGGASVAGRRADVLALLGVPPGRGPVRLLSIPRDLRVPVAGHGEQKLGGVYDYGSRPLLAAVRAATGIAVQHQVEVDFAGLAGLVDLLGGVPVDSPRRARDLVTGLSLPAGRSRLDGRAALALVRSRTYQELSHGRWDYVEPTDLGRIGRQQRFLAALLAAARDRRDPAVLRRVAAELGRHVTVDRTFAASDVRRWLRAVAGRPFVAGVLPSRPRVDPGEAASPFPPAHAGSSLQLVRQEPQATAVLSAFVAGTG